MPSRYHENRYPPFSKKFHPSQESKEAEHEAILDLGAFDSKVLRTAVLTKMIALLAKILSGSSEGETIYIGDNGTALLLFRVYKALIDPGISSSLLEENLRKLLKVEKNASVAGHVFKLAQEWNQSALKYFTRKPSARRITLLEGSGGVFALAAVLANTRKDKLSFKKNVDKLLALEQAASQLDCDELLYGRMGYVSALLFVDLHCGTKLASSDTAKRIVRQTIEVGRACAKAELDPKVYPVPWMWTWYKEMYLGAAHGVAGILHILLQLPWAVETYQKEIEQTLKSCTCWQFESGNFGSSVSSFERGKDELIHWCHGAPGFAMLFNRAASIFPKEKKSFLKRTQTLLNVIWKRGLLKKGTGICHGIAGNAYPFLLHAKATGDPESLYRAAQFADFLTNGKTEFRDADAPLSMFEGVAGEFCFYLDLFYSKLPRFPAFDLV